MYCLGARTVVSSGRKGQRRLKFTEKKIAGVFSFGFIVKYCCNNGAWSMSFLDLTGLISDDQLEGIKRVKP